MLDAKPGSLFTWYFSRGAVLFERSALSGMIAHHLIYSFARQDDGSEKHIGRCDPSKLDARPGTPSPSFDRTEPARQDLERMAQAGRLLLQMERAGHVDAVEAIGTYYGHIGEHFESRFNVGGALPRAYSLLVLVPEGRQLLRLSLRIDAEIEAREHQKAVARAKKRGDPSPPKPGGAELELRPYERMRELCFRWDRDRYKPLVETKAMALERVDQLSRKTARVFGEVARAVVA